MLPDSGIMVFETPNRPETRSTQRKLPPERPDGIPIAYDDHRLVANSGLIVPVTLAHRLGLGELADHHIDPRPVDIWAGTPTKDKQHDGIRLQKPSSQPTWA